MDWNGLTTPSSFVTARCLYRLGHYDDAAGALTTLSTRFSQGSDKTDEYTKPVPNTSSPWHVSNWATSFRGAKMLYSASYGRRTA